MPSASPTPGREAKHATVSCTAMGSHWPSHPELIAGLWLESPFTRLPADAPRELEDLLEDVHDPRRSYAVHAASRRHDFQSLVTRFTIQLREGCGDSECSLSSCLTCRKQHAQRTPLRRYSPTSARMLAVYMAGAANPYDNLCVALRDPSKSAARRGSIPHLVVKPRHNRLPPSSDKVKKPHGNTSSRNVEPSETRRSSASGTMEEEETTERQPGKSHKDDVTFRNKPANKDYRSFAAATFESVAIKMLQWLSPPGLNTINNLSANESRSTDADSEPILSRDLSPHAGDSDCQPFSAARPSSVATPLTPAHVLTPIDDSLNLNENKSSGFGKISEPAISSSLVEGRRRSTGSSTFSPQSTDARVLPKTTRLDMHQPDKKARSGKTPCTLHDRTSLETLLPAASFNCRPMRTIVDSPVKRPQPDLAPDIPQPRIKSTTCDARCAPQETSRSQETNVSEEHDGDISVIEYALPQTLKRFTPNIIGFLCDVYAEGSSSGYQTSLVTEDIPALSSREYPGGGLMRLSTRRGKGYDRVWKAFIDQAFFSVLSSPKALIESFTSDGSLLDSQTMWYCMVRLARAAPDVVFHSLWLCAERLLRIPKVLRSAHSAHLDTDDPLTTTVSNCHAGFLVSICLHALVAAAPVISDSQTLFKLSRLRGNGQTLSPKISPRDAELLLQYNDAFSNELAVRLARRLFLAISANRRYLILLRGKLGGRGQEAERADFLAPLLSQIGFLNSQSGVGLEPSPSSRLMHEARLPLVLLDWAKTIIMTDWRGEPYFARDSALGGAVAFIKTIFDERSILILGDVHFRIEFLSSRLDPVDTAINWVASSGIEGVGHVLDYPFLFSAETLVSFFRAINFARMSRTFESSRSLQTRMRAIVETGSLITNAHHKVVLGDMLRTASTRYLVVNVSRRAPLRDAFDQLWRRERRELLRPLKVKLGEDNGEEGFDSGGVQQEFFRLVLAECLNPDFGAFTVDDRTRMAWFVPGSLVEGWKFELIGVLVSLAIYNGLTLPITFPRAFYRKLLDEPVTEIHHIADGWPDLASGLTQLLEWNEEGGAVEDIFARTYEFSVDGLGTYVSLDMTQKDASWPQFDSCASRNLELPRVDDAPMVTSANRDDYVKDYVRYLTDVSVRHQFEAFRRGFNTCLLPKSLFLLSPSILQSVVEGIQDIDISELRRNVRYVGWNSHHRAIKDFWSVVKRYDLDMKRKLLEFVTASDRVPVGGFRNLQFIIQKNGEEDGEGARLPTAYTCYGTLLLPEYDTKEILRERLNMALENAQGFGFA